jgi:hypothetical protein
LDRLFTPVGYNAHRCRDCRRRFHFAGGPQLPSPKLKGRKESRNRRRILRRREFFVYALALFTFSIVAFVMTRERDE